jgi:hypothetical protein
MKQILKPMSLMLLSLAFSGSVLAQTTQKPVWSNQKIEFQFNPQKGTYSIIDKRDGKAAIEDASFSINKYPSTIGGYTFSWSEVAIQDALGKGQKITIEGKIPEQPSLILQVYLYDGRGGVVLNLGTNNDSKDDYRVFHFSPIKASAFKNASFNDFKTLDGESGISVTAVSTANSLTSRNNLLATFGGKGERKQSLVMGGLTYLEFQKNASVKKKKDALEIELTAEDPVGKLIDAKSGYVFSNDKFYIDITTDNRFDALETYADTMRIANNIDVSGVTIPILNFWYAYVAQYGGDEKRNNSVGTIEKMQEIAKTGFLKYSPVGLRLEPDDYALPNNQQGWWDDEHWQRYEGGQLLPPYDTMVKWGKKVREMGGVPFTYTQTAKRSQDYALAFPQHMLFNSPTKLRSQGRIGWWGRNGDTTAAYWTYDFTDPGFIAHMQGVYKNLKNAGIQGVKFDYPETGWSYDGGFEDKYATTTYAYRNIFKLAFDGLGKGADVYERMPPYGDIAIGAIMTQRTEGDVDRVYPARVSKTGLRWYKNRMVVNYDHDPINPHHVYPTNTRDGWRAAISMTYATSARMEIGKYFEKMSEDQRFDLSRAVPLLSAPVVSARPIDGFSNKVYPEVYDFKISPDWHIVTLFNQQIEGEEWPKDVNAYTAKEQFIPKKMIASKVQVALGDKTDDGGLGLNAQQQYYAFDFWNWSFIGKFSGTDQLKQELRPGEARVIAVHGVKDVPQFVSTSRHLLQGHLDMAKLPEWNRGKSVLQGVAKVIEGEPYKIIIAGNGYQTSSCKAVAASCEIKLFDKKNSLYEVTLNSEKNADVALSVPFRKM